MFKYYLNLILVLIISSGFSTDFNKPEVSLSTPLKLKCTYKLTYQPDSTDSQNRLTENMLLHVGKNFSEFQSLNRYLIDSIIVDLEGKGGVEYLQTTGINASTLPKTRFNYKLYKGYPEGKITVIDKILTDSYTYTEPKSLFSWKITPEKASIAGYNCQKATTEFGGRKYEAWFTGEVPVSDGPYKFNGLPGLIVKVNDTRNHYTFELTSLKQPQEPAKIVFPDVRVVSTSKKEFNKGLKDFNNNMAARLGLNASEEINRKARERAKKRNNPIELTD